MQVDVISMGNCRGQAPPQSVFRAIENQTRFSSLMMAVMNEGVILARERDEVGEKLLFVRAFLSHLSNMEDCIADFVGRRYSFFQPRVVK